MQFSREGIDATEGGVGGTVDELDVEDKLMVTIELSSTVEFVRGC